MNAFTIINFLIPFIVPILIICVIGYLAMKWYDIYKQIKKAKELEDKDRRKEE